MEFTIKLDGQELEELKEIVATIKKEQPGTQITPQQYAENIIRGFLQSRLRNDYVTYVQQQPVAELQKHFGKVAQLREARKHGK